MQNQKTFASNDDIPRSNGRFAEPSLAFPESSRKIQFGICLEIVEDSSVPRTSNLDSFVINLANNDLSM